MSPLIFQAAVQRLATTWQALGPVTTEDDAWSAVYAFDDFPDLPGWVHEVATANADRQVDVFRGTGGTYWTFGGYGASGPELGNATGRVPDSAAFVAWAESTDLPDHAAYERPTEGAGVLMGTFGWASFYLGSPTLEALDGGRDTGMHRAMGLLHLAGKDAPRHHRDGERWRRPLTVIADRDAGLAEVRHRGPQDRSYVADDAASAWLHDVLLGRPDADSHLLQRIEELVRQWRVHS